MIFPPEGLSGEAHFDVKCTFVYKMWSMIYTPKQITHDTSNYNFPFCAFLSGQEKDERLWRWTSSMVGRLNYLEKFATKKFPKLKERNKNLQESLNNRMISDMAAVKAELSALKLCIADQEAAERKGKQCTIPLCPKVQKKRPASSPDWTP